MAFDWIKKSYIARPEGSAGLLIVRHPDRSVPRGAKLTVRSDECVLFFREGRYIGRINAGTVLLDTANIPFLGHLVDMLTGANHFICELFFVNLRETAFDTTRPVHEDNNNSWPVLGQYQDIESANRVIIEGRLSYTVVVSDPAKLVIGLSGQSQFVSEGEDSDVISSEHIKTILTGRIVNQFRAAVGARCLRMGVMQITSNADAVSISEEVKLSAQPEFEMLGLKIGRIYDLSCRLDATSMKLMRDFGEKQAHAKLGTTEGYREFMEASVLEGLGKGLSTGNAAMMLGGLNLGGGFSAGSRPAPRPAAPRSGPVLGGQGSFYLRADNGETGPYSARQIALMAISKGMKLSEVVIRGSEDGADVAFSADLEPVIVAEYKRRMPASGASPSVEQSEQFDMAFAGAIADGKITASEFKALTKLAVTLGLDRDTASAEARVRAMAAAAGIGIDTE